MKTSRALLILILSLSHFACDSASSTSSSGGSSEGGGGSDTSTNQGGGGSPDAGGAGAGAAGAGGLGSGAGGGGEGGKSPTVDCTAIAAPPAPYETLTGFSGSEDFTFDELGNFVSVDGLGNLVRITKEGVSSLWIPNFIPYMSAGIVALPDGSVVACDVDNGVLRKAKPDGTTTELLGGLLYPNGLDVGPDGYLYVAENDGGQVRRVDPNTGDFTIAVTVPYPNGIAFTSDPTVFYVGSFELGKIYKVVQPVPGEPGTVTDFVENAALGNSGDGIDGLAVDACGNVYATQFFTGRVYRITPEGVASELVNVGSTWIPNLKWGRGLGGFERDILYVADRDTSSLFALEVGVGGVTEYYDL